MDNGKEKQVDIKPVSETMDSSSTKMENKWAKDIPIQRHRLTAHDTRKTQIYAYSNAENISCLLNAHMWTKDVLIDKRNRTHKMKTHTYTHARTQCLLIDVFAPLAFGYVCTCYNV